jgi:hypothetical protein
MWKKIAENRRNPRYKAPYFDFDTPTLNDPELYIGIDT